MHFILECVGSQLSSVKDYLGRYLLGFSNGAIRSENVTKQTQSRFQITPVGESFAFKHVGGKYLYQMDDGNLGWQQDSNKPFLTFTLEQKNGKTAFKTSANTYLTATEDGSLKTVSSPEDNAFFSIEDMCRIGNFHVDL